LNLKKNANGEMPILYTGCVRDCGLLKKQMRAGKCMLEPLSQARALNLAKITMAKLNRKSQRSLKN
jgi:hypothetical protein